MRIVDSFFKWMGAGEEIPPKEAGKAQADQVRSDVLPAQGGGSISKGEVINNAEVLGHEARLPSVLLERSQRALNKNGNLSIPPDVMKALFQRITQNEWRSESND